MTSSARIPKQRQRNHAGKSRQTKSAGLPGEHEKGKHSDDYTAASEMGDQLLTATHGLDSETHMRGTEAAERGG